MSKLDMLISELCPDRIVYKRLDECCSLEKGKTAIQKATPGEYPLVVTTAERKASDSYQFDRPAVCVPLVSSRGHGVACLNSVYYQEGRFALGNILCGVTPNSESVLNTKYLYYYLNQKKDKLIVPLMKGGANVSLTVNSLKTVKIPVPPIEVQQEIVRLIDTFDDLLTSMNGELDARRKQYDYYLNYLFEHQTDNLVPLNSIGKLMRGKRFVHKDATEDGVPCIHYGEIYTCYGVHAGVAKSHIREELRGKMRYARTGDVVIVGAGENNIDIGIGVAWEGNEEIAVHDACYTLTHNQNPRYISYYLRSEMYHKQIKRFVSEGKICSISAENIGKALIPLPSKERQNEIVQILNRFDKLCNDEEEGLPAEIAIRQKQYDYYREILLTL